MTLLNPYMNTSNAFAAYFLHIPKPFQQYNLHHNDIWKKKLFYDFDPQLFLVTILLLLRSLVDCSIVDVHNNQLHYY